MRLACLIVLSCVVLSGPAQQKKPAPLPPLNAKVVEFSKAKLGQKVGDGVCITLAVEALESAGARRSDFREPNSDYVWGEPVPDFKDVLPGDILQFRDAVFRGQKSLGGGRKMTWFAEYVHHTAIVAKVEHGGKLLTIYHQNVLAQGEPEGDKSKVKEGELRMEALQKGGWVKAYRPVSIDGRIQEARD